MMAHYAPAPPPLLHPIGMDHPPEPPNTEPTAGVGLKNSGGFPAGMVEHLEVFPDAVQLEGREAQSCGVGISGGYGTLDVRWRAADQAPR